MNGVISSKEALHQLSKIAPIPWCKRLLSSLIFDGRLLAYFPKGNVIQKLPISLLIADKENLNPVDGEKWLFRIEEIWGKRVRIACETVLAARVTNLVEILGYSWGSELDGRELRNMPFGYFNYADEVDWENGSIEMASIFPAEIEKFFFEDDYLLFRRDPKLVDEALFTWIEASVMLEGMCFEREAIDLLAVASIPQMSETPDSKNSIGRVGRPSKYEWEAALTYIVGLANTPDGLPTGYGAQSAIEKLLMEWFIDNFDNSPAVSELRKRAKLIVGAIGI